MGSSPLRRRVVKPGDRVLISTPSHKGYENRTGTVIADLGDSYLRVAVDVPSVCRECGLERPTTNAVLAAHNLTELGTLFNQGDAA